MSTSLPLSARYPFTPFPNSWYFAARSEEVPAGTVKSVTVCGHELVLFRGADGAVAATAAHCPHLGAHLGDGKVDGNTLRCPFHGWCFDGSGACVNVPYSPKVPKGARLRTWLVRERNGIVFVWHHADGAAPDFEIPALPEVGSPRWTRYHTLEWKANIHIQETAENAVDMAHFRYLHKHLEVPTLDLFQIDGPIFQVVFRAARKVLGRTVGTRIHLTYCGMGLVIARVHTTPVNLILLVAYTPIDAATTAIRLSFTFEKTRIPLLDRVLPFFLLRDATEDFARDIPIWEKKVYLERPLLAAGDGPIMKLRRWAQQFYPAAPAATAAARER
jgi:3-ketosteroid 9alpha-monooxygenase subunit A